MKNTKINFIVECDGDKSVGDWDSTFHVTVECNFDGCDDKEYMMNFIENAREHIKQMYQDFEPDRVVKVMTEDEAKAMAEFENTVA